MPELKSDLCACGGPRDRRAAKCRRCYSERPAAKPCTGCDRVLPVSSFYLRGNGGLISRCKQCVAGRKRAPELSRRYNAASRARPGHYRAVAQRLMRRRATDPSHKLADNLRRNLRQCIHRHSGSKPSPTLDLLGCTVGEFKSFIERQWSTGMSWENWGRTRNCWQLDHVRPVASFDLNDPDQLRACFHFSNYQPLWAIENAAKGAREISFESHSRSSAPTRTATA